MHNQRLCRTRHLIPLCGEPLEHIIGIGTDLRDFSRENRVSSTQRRKVKAGNHLATLNGKHTDDAINRHAHEPFPNFFRKPRRRGPQNLHANILIRLLSKLDNLFAISPIPRHQRLVCTGRDEVLGRERDRSNAVQMTLKLLQRVERDRRIKMNTPNVVEPDGKDFFLCQKIETADSFLNLETFLLFASLDIPNTDRLVVAPTDEALASKQQPGTKLGMTVEEPDMLRDCILPVGFTMV